MSIFPDSRCFRITKRSLMKAFLGQWCASSLSRSFSVGLAAFGREDAASPMATTAEAGCCGAILHTIHGACFVFVMCMCMSERKHTRSVHHKAKTEITEAPQHHTNNGASRNRLEDFVRMVEKTSAVRVVQFVLRRTPAILLGKPITQICDCLSRQHMKTAPLNFSLRRQSLVPSPIDWYLFRRRSR